MPTPGAEIAAVKRNRQDHLQACEAKCDGVPAALRALAKPATDAFGMGEQQRGEAEQKWHDLREHPLRREHQKRGAETGADNRGDNQTDERTIERWQLRPVGQ